ncbi:ThiF family adenylyltransferase [Herbidospora mongoliensis]|uniref:ThiF family adenylyltransferase n=1 Tax=Herbidospora mongoliensis TaxID=688067 RepID=UPI000A55E89D|nr:ThiF family adenylyltransferase [Herbidospora mongoliensis]
MNDWRPLLIDDRRAVKELLESGAVRRVNDTLGDPADYGTYVWYPWSGVLVRTLPAEEFRRLRTDRNRNKITVDEQRRLGGTRVGVVGLSVGNGTAVTLAMEGVGGAYKIADFDRLDLTNLNRIRAGLPDLGLEKTVLSARQMFELDPYLDIEFFSDGIHADNIDEFLLGGGRLDLVVEECDDLYAKVAVRERARAHRIPVLMSTSDRGMLDVERFDLEPDRPIFHGLLGPVRAEELIGLEPKDKIRFVLAMFDEQSLSPRMRASLPEVGRTLNSWPQLASDVAMGAGVVVDTARRLLLGEPVASGRYHLDPATLVTEETRLHG